MSERRQDSVQAQVRWGHGTSEEISLEFVAAEFRETVGLLGRLHALGGDPQAEQMPGLDDQSHQ